jgi:hypothetical protein
MSNDHTDIEIENLKRLVFALVEAILQTASPKQCREIGIIFNDLTNSKRRRNGIPKNK